ncbi:MAG TPA: hypothetical protein VK661_12110 [Planctomycetota bacterium]|nr:hypothetical protein [Planctomycetota bacterium]
MPEGPRFIAEIAASARETRLVVFLVLALVAPAILGWLSIRALANRGRIVCYVPEVKCELEIPMTPESP